MHIFHANTFWHILGYIHTGYQYLHFNSFAVQQIGKHQSQKLSMAFVMHVFPSTSPNAYLATDCITFEEVSFRLSFKLLKRRPAPPFTISSRPPPKMGSISGAEVPANHQMDHNVSFGILHLIEQ